jgi:signal transduction histidine kinase
MTTGASRSAAPQTGQAEKARVRPYTRSKMERRTLDDAREVEFDGLYAEAKGTLSSSANRLRATTQHFREVYSERLEAWQRLRNELAARDPAEAPGRRSELQRDADLLADALARAKTSLARLELTAEDLERSWLFLERGRAGNVADDSAHPDAEPIAARTLRMHVLEAQESERSRLAEDLHDGPAQAFANALFQIEIIDRSLRRDPAQTEAEVRALRVLLERELDAVRDYISQLRPTLLEDGGLDVALRESAADLATVGVAVETMLDAPDSLLDPNRRTVVLRIAQEALRNARKHAGATKVRLTTRVDESETKSLAWVLEIRDDGRGFDLEETLGRGSRRHFGLRFMRERADLIGARLEIEPDPSGTVVRLTIEDTERSQ